MYLSSFNNVQNQILKIPKIKCDLDEIDLINHKTKFEKIFTQKNNEKSISFQQITTIDLDKINSDIINVNPSSKKYFNLIF